MKRAGEKLVELVQRMGGKVPDSSLPDSDLASIRRAQSVPCTFLYPSGVIFIHPIPQKLNHLILVEHPPSIGRATMETAGLLKPNLRPLVQIRSPLGGIATSTSSTMSPRKLTILA